MVTKGLCQVVLGGPLALIRGKSKASTNTMALC
jgi:hypothetical protein